MRTLARFPFPARRLIFDGIPLLPVEHAFEQWYVPGRRTMSTQQLVALARKRKVGVFAFERGEDVEFTGWRHGQRVHGSVPDRTYTQL